MKQMQRGFTLIELIVVIVILGILAATALPKFVNFTSDARVAVINGIKGSLMSAATIGYSKAAATGKDLNAASGQTITVGASTVPLVYGFPDGAAATGIVAMLQDVGGATLSYAGSTTTFTLQTNCTVTYTPPTAANGNPSYGGSTSGC